MRVAMVLVWIAMPSPEIEKVTRRSYADACTGIVAEPLLQRLTQELPGRSGMTGT